MRHADRASTPPTILVVDDESGNRGLVRRILEKDYRVLEASGASEAVDVVSASPVDLVLLDVMMPGMNGMDACRRIKEIAGDAFLPVILLTALHDQSSRNAGLEHGADDYVTKPFDRKELLLRVRSLVKVRRQEDVIRSQVEELRKLQALKEDLFALIVHDLRNPLTGIQGHLGRLELSCRDERFVTLRETVDKAGASARRLRDLLDDVLSVQALEEGRLPIQLERVSLEPVLREALDSVDGAAGLRAVRLELSVPESVEGNVDRRLVRRCVENIVGNAVRYSGAGGVVEVVTTRMDDGGAAVEVLDRGPGIPDEAKARIFEKFATGSGPEKGPRKGFGLGLHLVRLVMERHRGRVVVADREGGGAIFRLEFPEAPRESAP